MAQIILTNNGASAVSNNNGCNEENESKSIEILIGIIFYLQHHSVKISACVCVYLYLLKVAAMIVRQR